MDSFFDDIQPRKLPQPASLTQDCVAPAVPEVSLLFNRQGNLRIEKSRSTTPISSSYNAWRVRSNIHPLSTSEINVRFQDKENSQEIVDKQDFNTNENILKKQVRFDNNYPQRNMVFETKLSQFAVSSNKTQPFNSDSNVYYSNQPTPCTLSNLVSVPQISTRRELDLSLLDPRPPLGNKNQTRHSNTTERIFEKNSSYHTLQHNQFPVLCQSDRQCLQTTVNNPSNHIEKNNDTYHNWVKNNIAYNLQNNKPLEHETMYKVATERTEEVQNISGPTVSDLYKMIQMQNEQLKSLQNQVELLLRVNKDNSCQIAQEKTPSKSTVCIQTEDESIENDPCEKQTKLPMPMVSVGVMTSFSNNENKDTIYKPADDVLNLEKKNTMNNIDNVFKNTEDFLSVKETSDKNDDVFKNIQKAFNSKKQLELHCNEENVILNHNEEMNFPKNVQNMSQTDSSTSTDSKDQMCFRETDTLARNTDCSLILTDPIEIQENTPTPPGTVHLEMEEYSTDDSSDDEQNYSPENNIRMTIWNNIVEQVKNILERSPKANFMATNTNEKRKKHCYECNPARTAPAQNIGLNFVEEVKNATLQQLKTLGISFADADLSEMNAAFSQYNFGPSDMSVEINQLMLKYLKDDHLSQLITKPQTVPTNNNGRKFGMQSNEISISTVRYMEKYNLFEPKHKQCGHKMQPLGRKLRKNRVPEFKNVPINKILDMTALKQQPKLL